MNPKTIAAALALFSITSASAGEAVTLTWKKDASEADNLKTAAITLAAGESVKALWGGRKSTSNGSSLRDHSSVSVSVTRDGGTNPTPLFDMLSLPTSTVPLQIAGPAVIQLATPGDASVSVIMATFDVTRVGTASPPAEVPQEAGSNFDVILEQSSDLVNWTPANPGTYSGTETKRFFRTRIVKK
jgi:hypothetical protein